MPQTWKSAMKMAAAVIGVAGGLTLGGAIPAGAATTPAEAATVPAGHGRPAGHEHDWNGDHGHGWNGDHGHGWNRHHGHHGWPGHGWNRHHHGWNRHHHGWPGHGRNGRDHGYSGARLRVHRAVSCHEGHFCAYDRNDFRGKIWDRAIYPAHRYGLAPNRMNSGINNSRYKVCVYDINPRRLLRIVRPHHSFPTMGAQNNRADYIAVVWPNRACPRM